MPVIERANRELEEEIRTAGVGSRQIDADLLHHDSSDSENETEDDEKVSLLFLAKLQILNAHVNCRKRFQIGL